MPCPSHPPRLDHYNYIGWRVKVMKLSVRSNNVFRRFEKRKQGRCFWARQKTLRSISCTNRLSNLCDLAEQLELPTSQTNPEIIWGSASAVSLWTTALAKLEILRKLEPSCSGYLTANRNIVHDICAIRIPVELSWTVKRSIYQYWSHAPSPLPIAVKHYRSHKYIVTLKVTSN
jgi:hypothetical protein